MFDDVVYAITLNWNRLQDTIECIESLLAQSYPGLRILVVDNASSDGSPREIGLRFPQVEQIVNSENIGFGRGFNKGINYALDHGAKMIFLINNDAIIAQDGMEYLIKALKPGIGMVAPLIFYSNPSHVIWSAGSRVNRYTLEAQERWRGKPAPKDWPEFISCDFITGCCLLITRDLCQQVGLFDEEFLMYYEDMDFCRRVVKAGLGIGVVPAAHAWHKVSSSSGGLDSPQERYWMAYSSIRYFRKHAEAWQWVIIAFIRISSALKTSLRLIYKGRISALKSYWRGLFDGIMDNTLSKVKKNF